MKKLAAILMFCAFSVSQAFAEPSLGGLGLGAVFLVAKDLPAGRTLIQDGQEVNEFDPSIPVFRIVNDPRFPGIPMAKECEITARKPIKAGKKLKMNDGAAGGFSADYELSKDVTIYCSYPPTEQSVHRELPVSFLVDALGKYFLILAAPNGSRF